MVDTPDREIASRPILMDVIALVLAMIAGIVTAALAVYLVRPDLLRVVFLKFGMK